MKHPTHQSLFSLSSDNIPVRLYTPLCVSVQLPLKFLLYFSAFFIFLLITMLLNFNSRTRFVRVLANRRCRLQNRLVNKRKFYRVLKKKTGEISSSNASQCSDFTFLSLSQVVTFQSAFQHAKTFSSLLCRKYGNIICCTSTTQNKVLNVNGALVHIVCTKQLL